MAQRLCCPVAGIGIHFLTPTPSPPPLPRLLGFNGDMQLQEQMAKGHGYGFNMGHGKIIPFKDYKEAAEALMERNFPEILHDRQTEVVFIPTGDPLAQDATHRGPGGIQSKESRTHRK